MTRVNEKSGVFELIAEMTIQQVRAKETEFKTNGFEIAGMSFKIPAGKLVCNADTFGRDKPSIGYLGLTERKRYSLGVMVSGQHNTNNETYSNKFASATLAQLEAIAKRPTAKIVVESVEYAEGTKSLLKVLEILS